jgi:hypothetical protein
MYPTLRQACAAALVIIAILLSSDGPRAYAHGGGGGGHGGGHGHSGASSSNHSVYTSYHGRGHGNAPWLGTDAAATAPPVWEGFPDDLPFARLQRFFANHLHHLRLPARHVS